MSTSEVMVGSFLQRGDALLPVYSLAHPTWSGGDIAGLLTEIGSDPAVIVAPPGITLTLVANVTIPENVTLDMQMGIIDNGAFNLTIDGPFRCGNWQAFDKGAGAIHINRADKINPRWYGALGDEAADDSVACAAAWAESSRVRLDPTEAFAYVASMHWTAGRYLITQNNFIGANLTTQALYSGRGDNQWTGDGRNTSVIVFKPSTSSASMSALYYQSLTQANLLNGFRVESVGFRFDDSDNGGNPIHFIKSNAASNQASQNWRLDNCRIKGVDGSITFSLNGTLNEDTIICTDVVFDTIGCVYSPNNNEALLHWFIGCTYYNQTGNTWEYDNGGCLGVWGGDLISEGTTAVDTAVLKVTGGTNSQVYAINGLRAELRGATTRWLIYPNAAENTITFTDCSIKNVTNGQAWALVVSQSHATITFKDCILPERTGTGDEGCLKLSDAPSGQDYDTVQGAHSLFHFIRCAPEGDRGADNPLPWVDDSDLTGASANYRTWMATYEDCPHLPNMVQYGHVYRQGRSYTPKAPEPLIFRGTLFPYGDGVDPVDSAADFNVTIPQNNFVSEIYVARRAMSGATNYQIEFIDTLERTSPGTGVIFGETGVHANNTSWIEHVVINRPFPATDTEAERTIWARVKTGVTLTLGQPGTVQDGVIKAITH